MSERPRSNDIRPHMRQPTPTTDRDELVELFREAHEADDCNQMMDCDPRTIIRLQLELQHLESRIQADAATIAGMRAALVEARDTFARYAHLHQMKGTNEGMAKAVANNELALKMAAALKGGDHG